MHDDVKLAYAVVTGARKTQRSLASRFRDEIEMALEHCRVSVELGLKLEEYSSAVIFDAARSLMSSYPVGKADASLDPHVTRILSHRDYALALLLRRQVEDAWRRFVQRFGGFIRSLFIRDGKSYEDAQVKLDEVVRILSDESDGPPPICGYHGSVDLNNWLYCFVRSEFPKRRAATLSSKAPPTAKDYVLPLVLHEEELREHISAEFKEIWEKTAAAEKRLLATFAHGGLPLDLEESGGEDTKARVLGVKQIFEKHSALVRSISQDLRKRVVGHYRGLVSSTVVEEAIIDVITGELVVELAPIIGSIETVEGESR